MVHAHAVQLLPEFDHPPVEEILFPDPDPVKTVTVFHLLFQRPVDIFVNAGFVAVKIVINPESSFFNNFYVPAGIITPDPEQIDPGWESVHIHHNI